MTSPLHFISNNILQLSNNPSSEIRKQLLLELNTFRKNPQSIIPYLKNRKENYSIQPPRLMLFSPHHPQKGVQTVEGPQPISQLIGTLHSRDPMPVVVYNPFLSLIAQQIASHFTTIKLSQSMGLSLRKQLNNSMEYDFVDKITCLIGVGYDKDEYQPLLTLLIDDGSPQRKNRELLMNRNWRFVGIGVTRLEWRPQLRVGVYLLTGNVQKK